MSNHIKAQPKGLDIVIQKVQNALYKCLVDNGTNSIWFNSLLDAYGRCYITDCDGKKDIEHFINKNDYKTVLFSEGNKFFFVSEYEVEHVNNSFYKSFIDLYFVLNIAKIKTAIPHRADEEVRVDVLKALNNVSEVNVSSVETNISSIFNGFVWDKKEIDGMQPYHIFKIKLETVPYNINDTYCN